MIKKQHQNLRNNEQGIVSIVLTVFVLIVLSLVVVAFSQNTRREQRQSLDRQLSAQAFYAAESGINQVMHMINTNDPAVNGVPEVTDCNDSRFADKKILDSNAETGGQDAFSLSCMLFNRTPYDIQWGAVDTRRGELVSLHTTSNDLNKLKITWTKSEGGNGSYGACPAASPTLESSYPQDCSAGMLRVMLVPYANGDSSDALYNRSYTVFLKPTRNGAEQGFFRQHGSGSAEANTQGNIVSAKCTDNGRCEAIINDLPIGGNLFMQIRSIYHANAVDISGQNVSNEPLKFDQAQVKIDVTGRASDVVRRVQVRKPLLEDYVMPASVIDSFSGVCKRLGVYPRVGTTVQPYANNAECARDGGNGL